MTVGSRGGAIHSLDEAQAVQAAYKREVCELVRSSILDVLARTGEFTADDLLPYDLPVAAENVIGGVTAGIARKGLMRKVGWVRSENPARHGAENRKYVITDQGRAEFARAGVSAGAVESGQGESLSPSPGNREISADPGSPEGEPEVASSHGQGGGDTNSQPGTVAAPDNLMQLPLGDVPQAQTRRASYEDYDMEAA